MLTTSRHYSAERRGHTGFCRIEDLDLCDVVQVGFSTGGGEVAGITDPHREQLSADLLAFTLDMGGSTT